MQLCASALSVGGQGWSPGEIAWSVLTADKPPEVLFLASGVAWKQEGLVVILAADPESLQHAIE